YRLVAIGALMTMSLLPVAADNGTRDDVDGDLVLMQGKWKLVEFAYYESGNQDRVVKAQHNGLRIVTGNKYHMKLRLRGQLIDRDYTFKLYPYQTPKAFDVTLPDGRVVKGIYEVDGTRLRRCYSHPDAQRPQQFQAGTQTYQEWDRVVEVPK
ncbi:MAG: TIGR03067 domain-containing protein, partial [Planctomycetales bacterium]